jgi:two-component system sensor histidine kinase YesM
VLQRIRRSLALKLVLASAVPSAAVLLVGLTALINHSHRLSITDPAAAFVELRTGALLGTFVALLFAGAAIAYTTRRFLTRPMKQLGKVMARAESGEFLVRAKVESEDEFGRLSRSFNTMLSRVTDMAVHEIETRRSLEQMEREVSLRRELESANTRLAANLREVELLLDVTSALSGTLDLPEQLEQLGRHVRRGWSGARR